MMESMMNLPDDMFRLEILPFLTVHDIGKLDNACLNHKYRHQLLEKIDGVILIGDKDKSMKASLFQWLGMRRIYLINMYLRFEDDTSFSSYIENDYVDQFRYTQYLVMRGCVRDDMAIFIISHCPCLLSIDISTGSITDHTLQSIAEHCTGQLQSLSLFWCHEITDTGLITISEHCPHLKSLKLDDCHQITDASIILISTRCIEIQSLNLCRCNQITDATIILLSTHCTGLQSLNLTGCRQITDASIISISIHCIRLQSLNLCRCNQTTDASIISISTHCTGLQSLNLYDCNQITDASMISISTHCTGLQLLNLYGCDDITDTSIISISENCTVLKRLEVSGTAITDASLIAIAKNCTGLQLLCTYGCSGLSSDRLRHYFYSLSELRASLLSIYPSLPI